MRGLRETQNLNEVFVPGNDAGLAPAFIFPDFPENRIQRLAIGLPFKPLELNPRYRPYFHGYPR